jgi:hypothetical protein
LARLSRARSCVSFDFYLTRKFSYFFPTEIELSP